MNDSAFTGASLNAKSMRRWLPYSGSANSDYSTYTQKTLVARCRDAYRNQAIAAAAVKRVKHNALGNGLRLQTRLDPDFLGISKEEAKEKQTTIERNFELWAGSVEASMERDQTFYQMQNLALVSSLISGDCFANTVFMDRPGSPYSLKVQLIESDRVSNPNDSQDTLTNIRGVEVNDNGEIIAYNVLNQHPGEFIKKANKWQRIEVFGKESGRRRVLHIWEKERPGQVRGIPYLSPILESLRQLDRYTEAELTAAVVSGLFNVFIKTLGGFGLPPSTESTTEPKNKDEVALKSGAILELSPGESIEIANPTRPNPNYDLFFQAILRQIGAALGLPIEFLQLAFNTSYSASRAAILQAWKLVLYFRENMATMFCQPIYELFFDELVARGLIVVPGYDDPLIRFGWTRAKWVGPSRGSINEKDEMEAAKTRLQIGVSTLEMECEEMTGSDWLDIGKQQAVEKKFRVENGLEEAVAKPEQNKNVDPKGNSSDEKI